RLSWVYRFPVDTAAPGRDTMGVTGSIPGLLFEYFGLAGVRHLWRRCREIADTERRGRRVWCLAFALSRAFGFQRWAPQVRCSGVTPVGGRDLPDPSARGVVGARLLRKNDSCQRDGI